MKKTYPCFDLTQSTHWIQQLQSMVFGGLLVLGSISLQAQNLTITNGLQLWLKADAGITKSAVGAVMAWADQSGKGNSATQADETLAPAFVSDGLNGKPVVRFDGNDDYLDVATAPSIEITSDLSSFFVVKFDDFATYRAVWGKTLVNIPAPTDYYLLPNSGIARFYRGSGVVSDIGSVDATVAVRAGNFVVLGFQMAGTTVTHYLNGQAVGTGEITATLVDGGTSLKIGSRDDLFTKMKGDIAELVIFDRALSATERTSLVTYLQTKYGIANQPPTVSLTSPANNSSVTAPAVVTMNANATDSDGVVTKVDFFANGALVGTATAAPYKLQLRIETAGSVTLSAVATDNKDATTATTNIVTATGGGSPALSAMAGLQLWLKADAGVTKSAAGSVTVWKDQSGKGNDAVQPDESLAPVLVDKAVNGNPVLRFDGVDDYLDVATSASVEITGDITSFFLVKFDDFATYRSVWGKTAGNVPRPTDYYLLPNTGIPRVYRGSDTPSVNVSADGAPVAAGSYVLLGFSQSGSTMTHYMSTRPSGSGQLNVTPSDSGTPLKIGSRDDFVTKMKGDIAELLIYDKALSESERTSLAIYLGAKYGIPIVQPSNSLPVVTLTAPVAGATVIAPANLTVTATATDSDGSIVKVEFYANGGLIGTATKSPYRTDFLIPIAGKIALTAVATDNLGARVTSTETVVAANSPNPSALPVSAGLQLWLKADGGVTANAAGLVSAWADFSGNFNNALQLDSSAEPLLISKGLNQLPTLKFDGVNDYLEIPHAASLVSTGDITSMFVVKFDDFDTYRAVWAKTAGNVPRPTDYYLLPNTGIPRVFRGGPAGNGNVDAGEPIPAGTFVIAGFESVGTTMTLYLDGRDIGNGEITATPVDVGSVLRIGTRGDFVTRMKGEIAEILIYNNALSDADRDKVTEYLRTKYFTVAAELPKFTGIRTQGNSVILEWTGKLILEQASQINGTWTAVAGASSPFTVTATGQAFFRLRL